VLQPSNFSLLFPYARRSGFSGYIFSSMKIPGRQINNITPTGVIIQTDVLSIASVETAPIIEKTKSSIARNVKRCCQIEGTIARILSDVSTLFR